MEQPRPRGRTERVKGFNLGLASRRRARPTRCRSRRSSMAGYSELLDRAAGGGGSRRGRVTSPVPSPLRIVGEVALGSRAGPGGAGRLPPISRGDDVGEGRLAEARRARSSTWSSGSPRDPAAAYEEHGELLAHVALPDELGEWRLGAACVRKRPRRHGVRSGTVEALVKAHYALALPSTASAWVTRRTVAGVAARLREPPRLPARRLNPSATSASRAGPRTRRSPFGWDRRSRLPRAPAPRPARAARATRRSASFEGRHRGTRKSSCAMSRVDDGPPHDRRARAPRGSRGRSLGPTPVTPRRRLKRSRSSTSREAVQRERVLAHHELGSCSRDELRPIAAGASGRGG